MQLDAFLCLDPVQRGRSRITEDDYLEGPPELIVEIAASSAAYDLHDKKHVYQRSEVFPGLWLQPTALWPGDLAAMLATLQQGLASPEHTALVAQLQPA